MIKNETKLFNYIDNDFENWNVVDKYPDVEEREFNTKVLKKDSTFAEMFTEPEKQWVTQNEVIKYVKSVPKETFENTHFFLLKGKEKFFVAGVGRNSDGGLGVYVNRFSNGSVWNASDAHRIVVPATEPKLLNSQELKTSDTMTLEQAINFIKTQGFEITLKK